MKWLPDLKTPRRDREGRKTVYLFFFFEYLEFAKTVRNTIFFCSFLCSNNIEFWVRGISNERFTRNEREEFCQNKRLEWPEIVVMSVIYDDSISGIIRDDHSNGHQCQRISSITISGQYFVGQENEWATI